MKRRITVFALLFALLLSFTGCDEGQEAITNFIQGDVTGELSKTYSTQWFDFTVNSIKTAYVYDGYDIDIEGYKYVIVSVSETNTFDEAIPMFNTDFELRAEGLAEEDKYPYEAYGDNMMPDEFELAVDESVTYDVVFSIPDEITDIEFVYVEIDEDENIGATFTVKHSL